ncbi:hypothetical protein [Brevundimonas sp.]|uniref:hypothetical protein n=1 Tax=Brevundimonas sp. TaxID=1871086 RepID=UPI0037C0A7DD
MANRVLIAVAVTLASCATTPEMAADPVGQCRVQAARLSIRLGEPDPSRLQEFLAIGPAGEDRFTTTFWSATDRHDEVACTCKNGEPISLAVGDAEVWER